jgi:hypothetical protein
LPRSLVNQGTVFVRHGLLQELSSMAPATEFLDSWWPVPDHLAAEVKRRAKESSRSLSLGTPIEADAFGCDSKVMDRAASRVLEKARDQAFDLVEIMEMERREESGVEYVSILSRAARIPADSRAILVESGVGSAARQPAP